ncbi:hypothetical protein ACOMHN_002797 [Nucella lapillus]
MLSRFERGRLPVAARLPALLWIVFFYSLNNLKMVDFWGFKHSDVPKEGRGSGNKHRGVQKSKRLGLNIPKKADFRGFKHLDVPEGARGKVNKHRGVQKSKKNVIALRAGPAARGCPFTRLAVNQFFYSLNIPKMVDFRGFKHSDVPTGAGEVGTSIRESKKAHIGGGGLNIRKCSTALL